MKILGRELIDKFKKKHSMSRKPLDRFVAVVHSAIWEKHSDITDTFNSADKVGENLYIFNIKGNDYRLEARIKIINGTFRILEIMTHSEYDKKKY